MTMIETAIIFGGGVIILLIELYLIRRFLG